MSIIQKRKVILASRSPARRAILADAGLKLGAYYSDIDETRLPRESVERHSLRLAYLKAIKCCNAYYGKKRGTPVVIGVDTVIFHAGKVLGKPRNKKEAFKFLSALSGKWHKVYTGVAVIDTRTLKALRKLVVSRVRFTKLTKAQISWYIRTGEPMRAAGAYSIQGKGRALIGSVDGCFTNVIGISIPAVLKMLKFFQAV